MSEVREARDAIEPTDPLGSPLARAAFEASSQGSVVLSTDGSVIAANRAFCDLYEIVWETAPGRHFMSFSQELEIRRFGDRIDPSEWVSVRALRGEAVSGVVQLVRNLGTGREFYGRYASTPVFEQGIFSSAIVTVEDVTDYVRALQTLEGALSAAEAGTYRVDLVKSRIWADQNFARIHGLTPEEAKGGPLSRLYGLVHPDDLPRVKRVMDESTLNRQPHELVYRVLIDEKDQRWLLSRGKVEYDDEGTAIQRIGSVVDITRRKLTEEKLRSNAESFQRLLQKSPFGVFVIDARFKIGFVSEGARRLFSNVASLEGRNFADVLRSIWFEPEVEEHIGVLKNVLETGRSFHDPVTLRRQDGSGQEDSYDWVVERVTLANGHIGLACHFYDLSDRLRIEAELESRVEERTAELIRANRDLNEFAYSVAHDLRAPLRAIVATSRILLEDAGDRLNEDEQNTLNHHAASAIRLARIVDDLLQFARLSNAEPSREEFDMTELAQLTAEIVRRQRGSPCTISIQGEMRALGDRNLVGYVLTNLLDNACKFSPNGGTVEVFQDEDAFAVRDHGIGFDMAHANKLFVAFERLVSQDGFEGTGVGLANAKRIVERHGGQIWAESEPGKGSTFRFTLG